MTVLYLYDKSRFKEIFFFLLLGFRKAQYTSNLLESFWYIWGTLLRGSLSGSPYAISSRIVSSAWWFFCLIVTSIYTANLAAFLTITIGDAGWCG